LAIAVLAVASFEGGIAERFDVFNLSLRASRNTIDRFVVALNY
jgi:hypothetical protein